MNDARYTLANLYLLKNQYVKASGEFQSMWSSNPPDNRGFIGLQAVKLAQGKGEEAVRAVQEFVDKNPKAPAYRYQLANLEASAAMQVMKSDPAREKILCRKAAGNYKELLRTTASAAPSSTDVWLRLGVMQRELGE